MKGSWVKMQAWRSMGFLALNGQYVPWSGPLCWYSKAFYPWFLYYCRCWLLNYAQPCKIGILARLALFPLEKAIYLYSVGFCKHTNCETMLSAVLLTLVWSQDQQLSLVLLSSFTWDKASDSDINVSIKRSCLIWNRFGMLILCTCIFFKKFEATFSNDHDLRNSAIWMKEFLSIGPGSVRCMIL